MAGPTRHNKKGMFENNYIRQNIVKPYLALQGADPLGQRPLPDIKNLLEYPSLREDVLALIKSQGYPGGPWFYKGAKMCLVWPIWAEAFPDAKWIIVRRPAEDIADSCVRTSFMKAYRGPRGWLGWVAEHEKRFREMKKAGLDVTEIWTDKLIQGKVDKIRDFVNEQDDLTWNYSGVMDFISPELWKGGKDG